jgi:hypothetical protein
MKVTNVRSYGFEDAIYAMRLPLDSHNKSDSYYDSKGIYHIGEEDKKLSMKLIKAGSDHRKHIRLMKVGFTVELPLYLMKELDTYKIGTDWVTSSTMHKLGSRLLNKDDFETDNWNLEWEQVTGILNSKILKWQDTKDKAIWREIIQLLPQAYLYRRTVVMSYEALLNMYNSRKNHKLVEWRYLLSELLTNIRYPEFIQGKFQ